MPCRLDPFTYDHKEHAIAHNDHDHLNDLDDVPLKPAEHDNDDQPVTVADLLDAYLDRHRDDAARQRWFAARDSAPSEAHEAAARIERALHEYGRLSPSERAEFDRRTT